jgi:hypothetical protein
MRKVFPNYNFIVIRKDTQRYYQLIGKDYKYIRKNNKQTISFILDGDHFTILCQKNNLNVFISTDTIRRIGNLDTIFNTYTTPHENLLNTILDTGINMLEFLGCT